MKTTTSRRAFLKKMALGLVAFVPAVRALASDRGNQQPAGLFQPEPTQSLDTSSPPPPPPPPGTSLIVDKYATGEVTEVSRDRILLKTSYGGNVVLRLLPETAVWKGEWNGSLPIEVGDQIKAWGEPRTGGTFDVEKMWVNIVNLRGTISNIERESGGLRLRHHDACQGLFLVKIDQRTLVNRDGRAVTFGSSPIDLREGRHLQIVGLKLKDGSVLATRLLF